jgi:phosphatidate cytidylyltransferase
VITLNHRNADVGGSARRTGADRRNLLLRFASAIVLAPIVLAAAYAGGWYFLILCGLAGAAIVWEWTRLVTGRSDLRILVPGFVALLAALALTGNNAPVAAASVIALGAAAAGIFAVASPPSELTSKYRGLWAAAGVVYAGVAFLGPALLRRGNDLGFSAFLFLAATVWMTDICAYLVGRTVGGPLLWPRVSPNKTWAGAIGGLAGGVAGGTLLAYAGGISSLGAVGVIALLLSGLAQAGDLFESAIKRHFGAKDTSQLIPGHGGLMDRLDGFLVAAAAALIIGILHQGAHAPARGLLVW